MINARDELQASEELRAAAETLSKNPALLQLRYLQTLLELGADHNSTWSSRCQSTSAPRSCGIPGCSKPSRAALIAEGKRWWIRTTLSLHENTVG